MIKTGTTGQFVSKRSKTMQHVTNVQTATSLPARPAVVAKAKADARLAYIDTIRIILTILVIMVHAAATYGAFGDWTYNDNRTPENELISILLSLFLFICQSFFMGLFFFFSGYFTPGSYDRKGLARFWKDRLLRLGIPMLAYTYFLSRIPNYMDNAYDNHELRISFWQFTANTALRDPDGGPTWFLFALLVFSLGYTLWRIASRTLHLDLAWASRLPAPGYQDAAGHKPVFQRRDVYRCPIHFRGRIDTGTECLQPVCGLLPNLYRAVCRRHAGLPQ
jgi:hypothetical protein